MQHHQLYNEAMALRIPINHDVELLTRLTDESILLVTTQLSC